MFSSFLSNITLLVASVLLRLGHKLHACVPSEMTNTGTDLSTRSHGELQNRLRIVTAEDYQAPSENTLSNVVYLEPTISELADRVNAREPNKLLVIGLFEDESLMFYETNIESEIEMRGIISMFESRYGVE